MKAENIVTSSFIFVSLLILCISYGFIDQTKLSYAIFGVSVSGESVVRESFWSIAKVTLILTLFYAHVRVQSEKLYNWFVHGYRYNSSVESEVREEIKNEAEHDHYGAPVGNINPSLFNREHSFGQYQKPNGQLTKSINITLSISTHFFGLLGGLAKIAKSSFGNFVLPILIGTWAFLSIFT